MLGAVLFPGFHELCLRLAQSPSTFSKVNDHKHLRLTECNSLLDNANSSPKHLDILAPSYAEAKSPNEHVYLRALPDSQILLLNMIQYPCDFPSPTQFVKHSRGLGRYNLSSIHTSPFMSCFPIIHNYYTRYKPNASLRPVLFRSRYGASPKLQTRSPALATS